MNKNFQFLTAVFFSNFIVIPVYLFCRSKFSKKKASTSKTNEFTLLLFIVYLSSLFAVTIVPLPFSHGGTPYLNLNFFDQTYNNLVSALQHTSTRTVWNEVENIAGNVVLFVPMGIFLPILFFRKVKFLKALVTAFFVSFFIEAMQYWISINWGYNRIADIDDLAMNEIGALLGYIIYVVLAAIYKWRFII